MLPRTALRALFVGVCVSLVTAVGYAIAAEPEQAMIPLDQLVAACKTAKAEFRPISQADVQQAKQTLLDALDRLDQRLTQAGPNGDVWRTFLKWDALQEQLRGDQPDAALLTKIYQRYSASEEGLELVWFLDVQQALRNYIATAGAVDNPKIRGVYEGKLDKLAASLEAYIAKPTPENALVISETSRFLDDAGQAPALVRSIQSHFVHPNLFVNISSDVVGAGIAERVDDVSTIQDCILGTSICATAHTIGQTCAVTDSDPDVGAINTMFSGVTASDSVGYHRPVTIYSSSTTNLSASKRLTIDANGISSCPSTAKAETCININDIQSRKSGGMIERMAWKRAGKQQSQAEAIASRHAEARLNERVDDQAEEQIKKANEAYVEKFKQPFTDRKIFPRSLSFSTTDHALHVTGLQAGFDELAAPGAPPAVVGGADMSMCIHESMLNNLTLDALGGRTIYEEKVQSAAKDILGELPEKMKGDDDGQPWAITFARRQPISVAFADNGYKVTIRGAAFFKGGEWYPAMNITASYKIEHAAKGFKAVRQGPIEVFPPDFVPGGDEKIDARRQIIRKLLEKRFAKVFEPELLGEGLELPGKWKAAGKLLPIQVEIRDGWLIIAWKRAETATK